MDCGRIVRKTGEPCKRAAMANGRCQVHGGKIPHGFALPQTKHGRYSKYLPTRLADRYEEAERDPNLLRLDGEIALIDVRLRTVLDGLGRGESPDLWELLQEAWADYEEGQANAVDRIGGIIAQGIAEQHTWKELRSLIRDRVRLVESERKRLVELNQMITAEQAMLFMAAVVDTVRRYVSDRDALARISHDLRALSVRESGG
jgi:hypothetical protein